MRIFSRITGKLAASALVAILLTAAAIVASKAHEYDAGKLNIGHPWTRPTLGDVMIGAVYMVVSNDGDKADTLVSAQSDIAERVEIHETVKEGDIAKMQQIKGGVEVPPDDAVVFAPLGKHIMLLGLKRKLKDGETFPLKLVFKSQGELTIDVKVLKTGSTGKKGAAPKGSHGSHDGQ